MPLALIASSFVAASRVGGQAQALALQSLGIEPVLAPTTLLGRHPGWGPPGGAAVAPEVFAGVLQGIAAQGLQGLADLVITGYFVHPDQVQAAAAAIDAVRAAPRAGAAHPRPRVIVDTVLGDDQGGLYVSQAVAAAVREVLLPRADWLRMNLWELGWLSGRGAPADLAAADLDAADLDAVRAAARGLQTPCVVSSVPAGPGEIGVLMVTPDRAWLAVHARQPRAPKGTGDLLTALFGAALLSEPSPEAALARACAGTAEAVACAHAGSAPELPLAALGPRLAAPQAAVRLEAL